MTEGQRRAARWCGGTLALAAVLAGSLRSLPAAGTLDIYWIDVEGGASTLIVTPGGQSVLTDAGFEGFNDRDASRIARVVREEAGLKRLDYVVISHFHADHVGGLAALSRRVPIGAFVDHGDSVEKESGAGGAVWEQYLGVAGRRRRIVKPGERLALDGVDLTIVAADGRVLSRPLSDAGRNASCESFKPQAEDRGENGRSLGYVLRAGKFDFVNLGDLSWNFQHKLACPANLLGQIDLFQVTHHGTRDDVLPQQMWAMAPTVAVMNNGPTKGAGAVAVETVLRSPGLEDLWSLHRALGNDAAHNAREMLTANLGDTTGCEGAWIRARVDDRGSYVLTNSRNGHSRAYRVK
jgi:beta-lactamase superfamily II metal-dependent hydrolase